MATFNSVPDKASGDVFTEAMWDDYIKTNINNLRVRPMARIGAANMTGITDATATLVTGMSSVFDTDTMTGTANRITITTAGIYLVSGHGSSDSGTQSETGFGIEVPRFNSAGVEQEAYYEFTRTTNVGWGNALTCTGLFSCAAGDYFRLRTIIDGSAAGTRTLNYPRLWAVWMGQTT